MIYYQKIDHKNVKNRDNFIYDNHSKIPTKKKSVQHIEKLDGTCFMTTRQSTLFSCFNRTSSGYRRQEITILIEFFINFVIQNGSRVPYPAFASRFLSTESKLDSAENEGLILKYFQSFLYLLLAFIGNF